MIIQLISKLNNSFTYFLNIAYLYVNIVNKLKLEMFRFILVQFEWSIVIIKECQIRWSISYQFHIKLEFIPKIYIMPDLNHSLLIYEC